MDEFKEGKKLADEQYGRFPGWSKAIVAEAERQGISMVAGTGKTLEEKLTVCEADALRAKTTLERLKEIKAIGITQRTDEEKREFSTLGGNVKDALFYYTTMVGLETTARENLEKSRKACVELEKMVENSLAKNLYDTFVKAGKTCEGGRQGKFRKGVEAVKVEMTVATRTVIANVARDILKIQLGKKVRTMEQAKSLIRDLSERKVKSAELAEAFNEPDAVSDELLVTTVSVVVMASKDNDIPSKVQDFIDDNKLSDEAANWKLFSEKLMKILKKFTIDGEKPEAGSGKKAAVAFHAEEAAENDTDSNLEVEQRAAGSGQASGRSGGAGLEYNSGFKEGMAFAVTFAGNGGAGRGRGGGFNSPGGRGGRGGAGGGGRGSGSNRCFSWADTGGCKRGSSCLFEHLKGGGSARSESPRRVDGGNNRPQGICHQWQQNGSCSFGDECRFLHQNGDKPGTPLGKRR